MSRSRNRLLLGLVAAGLVAVATVPSDRAASAQPAGPLPAELQLVPADAAIFVHADAARIWGGPLGKSVRAADPATFGELATQADAMFGVTPDAVKSVTLFWPQLKSPPDLQTFGVVLTFDRAVDKDKLAAGFEKLIPKGGPKYSLHHPSDRVAVLLVGLDPAFAKPRPADKVGPITPAIREAAAGKHALVAASTLANLPDEIRGDNLPPEVRPFQPLFRAETVTALVGVDREITAEVRVKTATPAQAGEAEKALGLLVNLMQQGLTEANKALAKDEKDPALKDVFAVLKAAEAGLKGVKFATDGTEARATVRLPADLPVGGAYLAAVAKVRGAAAAAQSANNLKQIAIALHGYADVNGAFPPAAVVDRKGKPILSWRVLILPYVEQDNLYRQFKLDEPWDSPHNKKLLEKPMPRVYAVPVKTAARPNETHYRVFVGNGALFDYIAGPKFAQIGDGTSNTIMVVTAAEAVPWTKPDELEFDPDKDMGKLLGAVVGGRIQVAIADGSIRSFPKPPAKKTLNALITRNGGEPIVDDDP